MQERDKDDLADALSRMTSGHAAPEEDSIDDLSGRPASAGLESTAPAPAPPPATAPLFRPVQSEQSESSTPVKSVQSAPEPRSRPATPRLRPASPNLTPPARDQSLHPTEPKPAPARATARPVGPPPLYRRLSFRRTLIPILLTLGVMLSVLGALPLIVSADSPLAAVQSGTATTFIVVGLALLGLAIVNMIQVRHELRSA